MRLPYMTPGRGPRGPRDPRDFRGLPGVRPLVTAMLAAALAAPLSAQTPQTPLRTPNLPGPWVGGPGDLHLDLLHRFHDEGGPETDAVGLTTLSAAYGVGGYALGGVLWATGSEPGDEDVDEIEVMVRFSPFTSTAGAPADLGITAAYNEEYGSFDGELVVGLPLAERRFHLLGTLRLLGDAFGTEDSRWIVGGGGLFRAHERVTFSADILTAAEPLPEETIAWGADVRFLVPFVPATLSLEATNTRTTTLHASALRGGGTRWGARIHMPVPLRRMLGGDPGSEIGGRTGEADLVAGDTVEVSVTDGGFSPARVTVRPGASIHWTNDGGTIHSVVAADGSWESPLMAPGESFGRVFTQPGEHGYACRLHPEETGTVAVDAGAPVR